MSLTPEECEKFWGIADKDGNGELTIQELKGAINEYNPNLSDKQVAMIFCDIDKSGDKKISKQEFLNEMAEKPKRSEGLCQLFKQYDTSGDGKLSRDEIGKLLATCFKERDPNEVLAEFLEYADSSGDGFVTFDEFKDYFQ